VWRWCSGCSEDAQVVLGGRRSFGGKGKLLQARPTLEVTLGLAVRRIIRRGRFARTQGDASGGGGGGKLA